MDRSVTVSVKGLLVAAVVLLAVVVAYLLGDSGGTPSAQAAGPGDGPAAAPAEPERRTVTMRGVGEASVVPDQVVFDVSVRVVRDDLTTALDDAGATLDRVLARLEALGVPRRDVETTGLDMRPVYTYVDNAPPILRGYRVSQSVAVLVRELPDAGAAITAVVDEGGNTVRVSDIGLRVGDPEPAVDEARDDAVAAATAKAEQYAAATGQELGAVVTLVEVQPESVESQISRDQLAYDAVPAAAKAVPIRAGRSALDVTVQVVWELA